MKGNFRNDWSDGFIASLKQYYCISLFNRNVKEICRHEHVNKINLSEILLSDIVPFLTFRCDCWSSFSTHDSAENGNSQTNCLRSLNTESGFESEEDFMSSLWWNHIRGEENDKQIDIKTEIIYFLWAPQTLLSTSSHLVCARAEGRRRIKQHEDMYRGKSFSPCRMNESKKSFRRRRRRKTL